MVYEKAMNPEPHPFRESTSLTRTQTRPSRFTPKNRNLLVLIAVDKKNAKRL